MTNLILTNLYLFLIATVLALLEIQIEGPHGWAKNLPTWRPDQNHPLAKVYKKIMSGKEFTGYHGLIFLLVFLIFHLPYVFGLNFTLEHWTQTLSLYFMFIAVWDFLWFVLNPHYPLKNFRVNNPNHVKFFLGIPTDYLFATLSSFVILLPIVFNTNSWVIYDWWALNIVLFLVEIGIAVLFSMFILNIDNWRK